MWSSESLLLIVIANGEVMKINCHRQTEPRLRYRLGLGCWLIGLFIAAGCTANHSSPPQNQHGNHDATTNRATTPGPTPRVPAFFDNLAQARPLPAVLDPKQFSDPVVAKAYRYAQESPEVFAQQPCYCYCDDGHGHRSLLDCYATDHSAG